MLPIVQRELRVGARDPKLYRNRLRIGAVEILASGLLLLSDRPGGGRGGFGSFFWLLTGMAMLFCLLEGVRKTSDAISEERREGTLGFLFLTDLKGFDVALGKWFGAFIRSFSGLLAFIPILAVTLLFGGTTGGEFWRVVLVLVLALAVSLSICLAISALSKERSAGVCLATLAVLSLAPLGIGEVLQRTGLIRDGSQVAAISPWGMLATAGDAAAFRSLRSFWTGAAVQCGIAFVALVLASIVVPRIWQDKIHAVRLKPRSRGSEAERLKRRAKLLDKSPILWLAFPERTHRLFTITFMTLAVLFALTTALALYDGWRRSEAGFLAGLAFVVLFLLLAVQMASQASSSLAEARRNGTLELLLSTPLKVRDIVSGHWLALRQMFLPAALVLAAFAGCLCLLTLRRFEVGPSFWMTKFALEAVLEFFVLGWVGMWSGLAAKSPNGAFFRTLVLGLFLPFLLCTPTVINQAVLIAVASEKVKTRFRRFVAEKYLQDPKFVLPPALQQAGTPPVIR